MYKLTPVLQQLVSLITAQVTPAQIILFGSYARGDNTPTSDIDILIVVHDLHNERTITGPLYQALLAEKIPLPVDFLAIDYRKYHELKETPGYIYKTIAQEGKVLYG